MTTVPYGEFQLKRRIARKKRLNVTEFKKNLFQPLEVLHDGPVKEEGAKQPEGTQKSAQSQLDDSVTVVFSEVILPSALDIY